MPGAPSTPSATPANTCRRRARQAFAERVEGCGTRLWFASRHASSRLRSGCRDRTRRRWTGRLRRPVRIAGQGRRPAISRRARPRLTPPRPPRRRRTRRRQPRTLTASLSGLGAGAKGALAATTVSRQSATPRCASPRRGRSPAPLRRGPTRAALRWPSGVATGRSSGHRQTWRHNYAPASTSRSNARYRLGPHCSILRAKP